MAGGEWVRLLIYMFSSLGTNIYHSGVLARAKFYRAIADEAQFIRNRYTSIFPFGILEYKYKYSACSATRASISLAFLRAKYRWMLTGTPVTNTL